LRVCPDAASSCTIWFRRVVQENGSAEWLSRETRRVREAARRLLALAQSGSAEWFSRVVQYSGSVDCFRRVVQESGSAALAPSAQS